MENNLFSKILNTGILSIAVFSLTLVSGQYQSKKITASTRESRAEFGTSVAINDQFIAVGASREEVAKGAVYIHRKNGSNWDFNQKIKAPDGVEMAEFGGSIKFGTDFLLIAAGRADIENTIRAGALYVYDLDSNNQWNFTKKLVASDYDNDALLAVNPTSLAVDGNTIVAGAPGFSSWNGAVYIFEKNGNDWEETQKITSPESVDFGNFGIGVGLYGDYLVIGASGVNNSAGKIYIYKKNTSGEWIFHQSLTSSDSFENSYFGNSVSIFGNELVVGAYTEADTGNPSMAYIFKLNDSGNWEEIQKIPSYESSEHTYFAWMCELKNDKLIISAPHLYGTDEGRTLLYKKNSQNDWELDQELKPEDDVTEDFYGWSLAMNDNEIIVGASRENFDNNGENELNDAGSAYIFTSLDLATHENDLSKNDVKIYPNPAKYLVHIKSKKEINSVEILDQSGKRISESKESKINVSHLSKGIYILKIKFSNGSSSIQKLIKQ
ncbi:T9SS type A sorting domain-containing protein [Epilithonimonas caeni]|uniref:T9SS type A sorting domain-containing protein n=1 Tax=Epilithonimonas caeni TaxID=365343 RepID=UPI0003FA6D4A|nr:T9SS type A sorting domain-containing protein [Epilithonimonas caeni]